ncbi:RNA-binding motif protein 25 isoform X1 [Amaranthus tricolor]|uniref:RNA-binding motif protein 25 isoform X1 n=2 Tax=Amaranthus tricolor TaxID=29722 RepID=UPI002586AA4F|nr:RNA-binding motif protein 25 isoform X1 [Amaranthus tricolor]
MADSSPSPATTTQSPSNPPPSQSPILNANPNSTIPVSESQPNLTQPPSSTPPPPPAITVNLNPNPTSAPPFVPPQINPYAVPPSFRPTSGPGPMPVPQFTPIPQNPNIQGFPTQQVLAQPNHGVPPPGVTSAPPQQIPMMPGQPTLRPPFVAMPNGYMQPPNLPPGMVRYPYPSIVRPPYIARPGVSVGSVPPLPRPPFVGLRPPVISPVVRPPVLPLVVIPAEKPQTTVYVGKIASSVENDFIRSLLELCGPIKSWKRAQDPSDGTPRRFGFCEFESAEGVLRALRLLSKCNVDGEELVLNVNQATREYLERYVQKKKENLNKPGETGAEEVKKEGDSAPDTEKSEGNEKKEPAEAAVEDSKKVLIETENKENDIANFGLVSDEDRIADRDALDKLTNMIEERIKTKPPPPPPPPAQKVTDGPTNSNSEMPAKSEDKDTNIDASKNEEKHDDGLKSDTKPINRAGTESPDRSRRYDNRIRERERDRERRERERELERLERERERERERRGRERELEIQKVERFYKERVKEWEAREKEKEYERKREREKEKERERERRRLIAEQEDESDDDSRKRRRKSEIEDKRRRRRREKEEDLADRFKEEEELVEAKKRAEEEQLRQQEKEALELSSVPAANGVGKPVCPEAADSEMNDDMEPSHETDSVPANHTGDGAVENGSTDEPMMESGSVPDVKLTGNAPGKKLEFGLVGSGKRTTVPSVFHEEEDDDSQKEKKMRPLVPIDYSTEELQAVQTNDGEAPPISVASDDTGKRIISKDVKSDAERNRNRRQHDRPSHRERDHERGDDEAPRAREILDAKKLIDMIPKTKDDLFSYEVNWAVYDENRLHERMRPWISKKITEFLGEEETTLVDFIVERFREHVKAEKMLDVLQRILDEEAEMFVLKMWRMLIFEIKKVETGLTARS